MCVPHAQRTPHTTLEQLQQMYRLDTVGTVPLCAIYGRQMLIAREPLRSVTGWALTSSNGIALTIKHHGLTIKHHGLRL
jgi:secreted trypsin-like serine protease